MGKYTIKKGTAIVDSSTKEQKDSSKDVSTFMEQRHAQADSSRGLVALGQWAPECCS